MTKKRKDGLIEKTITVNGIRKHFYGKTNREVYTKIANYKEKNGQLLFKTVASEWWDEHSQKIEYNSVKSYRPCCERAIEWYGNEPIADIQPVMISKCLKQMAKTYADRTVKRQLIIINQIFKYAVAMGYVPYNPARDISAPSGTGKRKVTSPTSEDIEAIKSGLDKPFGLFAYMLLYTGLRRGELMALTYEDIDIENRTIRINKSLYQEANKPKLKRPKTETSDSYIPILDALLPHIPKGHGIIFTNSKGEYLRGTQFERKWKKYCEATGISCTPHQLRHCFATMLFEADVPPEKAQRLLRHAHISTTMDIYTDLRAEKQKEIFEDVYGIDIK